MTELYTDCSSLPLYHWIKIACTGDHKWLVKSGEIPHTLSEHYEQIYAEYQTLIKDTRTTQELKLKIQIAQLANRIDCIKIAVNQLAIERDEEIINILRNKLGFSRLSYTDLPRDLKLTQTYLQSDVIKLQQKQAQYDKLTKLTEGGNSEADFYSQISVLEKWKGSAIDLHTTSVLKWVSDLNLLKEEIRNSEKK